MKKAASEVTGKKWAFWCFYQCVTPLFSALSQNY